MTAAALTINASELRIGNFTSSEIASLMKSDKAGTGFGKPALAYIEECNMERRLMRSITGESNARALSWGSLVEKRAFDVLGTEYRLCSQETIIHPDIDFWAGSPDAIKYDAGQTVVDIKCPITLKSFCQLADCKSIDEVRDNHDKGEQYYWQLVSNACITKSRFAELIVYVPYFEELSEIRDMASNSNDIKQHRYYWIANADNEELPYLIAGGHYKNVNVIRFEVSDSDKANLTNRVEAASKLLIAK